MTPTITVCFLIILFLLWLWIAYEIKNAPLLENGEEDNETKYKNDEYDKQINYLRKNPNKIEDHWSDGLGLFRNVREGNDNLSPGCLTQIRRWKLKVYNDNDIIDHHITDLIQNDEKIPETVREITIESLPVFAYYQRMLDRKYKRKSFIFIV